MKTSSARVVKDYFCRLFLACFLCRVAGAVSSLQANPFTCNQSAFAAHAPIYAAGEAGGIRIWDTRTWRTRRYLTLHRDWKSLPSHSPLALSPDGQRLADVTADETLQMWDTKEGALLWSARPVWATHLLFTPDGREAVTSGGGGGVFIWEARSGRKVTGLPDDGDIAVSPNGRLLAVIGRRPCLWDLQAGKRKRMLSVQDGPAQGYALAFSRSGRLLATIAENPQWHAPGLDADGNAPSEAAYAHEMTILIWDVSRGKVLRRLPGPTSPDTESGLQFTADEEFIVSSGRYPNMITVRDIKTGRILHGFACNQPALFPPDGDTVLIEQVGPGAPEAQPYPPRIVALNLRAGTRRLLHP